MTAINIFGKSVDSPLSGSFDDNVIVPAGDYSFVIAKGAVSKCGHKIYFTLQLLDSEYVGQTMLRVVTMTDTDTSKSPRGLNELKSLVELFGIPGDITSIDVFINKTFKTNVRFMDPTEKYPKGGNWVSFSIDDLELYDTRPSNIEVANLTPKTEQFTAAEVNHVPAVATRVAAQAAPLPTPVAPATTPAGPPVTPAWQQPK